MIRVGAVMLDIANPSSGASGCSGSCSYNSRQLSVVSFQSFTTNMPSKPQEPVGLHRWSGTSLDELGKTVDESPAAVLHEHETDLEELKNTNASMGEVSVQTELIKALTECELIAQRVITT